MTSWRPPRTFNERTARAIRSMQNGSMDGRIVGAFPVQHRFTEDDGYEDEDPEEETGDDAEGSPLLPMTDYFLPSNSTYLVFQLTYPAWKQKKMAADVENRATVHIYWNGIFQRDLAYKLQGTSLTIENPDEMIREGDQITVKYWYKNTGGGEGGGDDENSYTRIYRMECWLTDVTTMPNGYGYGLRASGARPGAPLGGNSGLVSLITQKYANIGTNADYTSAFRLPATQSILTQNVTSMDWFVSYDTRAAISMNQFNYSAPGIPNATRVGGKADCGLGSACDGECPPQMMDSIPPFTASPSYGPLGGNLFATLDTGALSVANLANVKVDGENHFALSARFSAITGPTDLAGCGAFGVADLFDDSIYGKYAYFDHQYNVKMGVTCIATYSGTPPDES